MSLSVKIVDNETGEVFVDINDATCVMGAVARNGVENVETDTLHIQTKQFSYVRCNRATLYHILTALQGVIAATQIKYPGIEHIGEVLEMLRKMGGTDGN